MVDSGPFFVKSYLRGQRLRLERNPYYYRKDRPYLDAVNVEIGVEERVQVLRFENGQIDVLHYIPSADYPRFKADPKWAPLLVEGPVNTVWFLGMNTRMKPFDNLKVRQAVAHAVDQARVIRLLNGRGRPLAGILPPTMPGYDPDIKGYALDPERARTLLAEAGYPSGFSTTLWVASGERYGKIAQGVQADLKAVGIDAQLKPAALASYLSAIHKAGTTPIFYGGWFPDFPDPGNFLEPLFSSTRIHPAGSTNSSFLSDPAVDRLLQQGADMPAGDARLKVYERAQEAIMADAPWAPLYQEVESRLRQPNIGGLVIHPVWPYLRLAEIWKRASP
jgi:peptide/nickel transport system substrate-binding protein/oligopeptide transport system substrate-binding protein